MHNSNMKNWLAEQKWIICYFIALIAYQNPVYCVLVWIDEQPNSASVFVCYIFDYIAQASFFTIWLLFADGLSRKTTYFLFYCSKIFIGVLIFVTGIVVLTIQFPSLNPYQDRSSVEAVYNWTETEKKTFIAFSLSFLCLLIIWTIWWFWTLWSSFRVLQRVPYMSTRYLQLSFRFFSLQATLVAMYYIFQYFVVIYLILANSPPNATTSLENICDNINTLFRQQTQLFG